MNKRFVSLSFAALVLIAGTVAVRAEWPARVFAPYMYIGADDHFKLTECDDQCGQKFFTLAFIIARMEGRGTNATYFKEPSWDGRIRIEENLYQEQIEAIRARGGDVIMSFGGEAGKELANVIDDADQLEAAYQKVIDQYKFTWLDFDVEGNNLDKGKDDSERRNTVLAALQKKNPGLVISYTLPADPNGLSDASQALLTDAVKKGVSVHSANLMVMYFGKRFINKGKSEGQLGVDSANTAYAQLQKIDPKIQVGLCPCLGRNGSKDEVFVLDDAKTLEEFAAKTPWVCSLHFWSVNADSGRPRKRKVVTSTTNETGVVSFSTNRVTMPSEWEAWAFSKTFQGFEARQNAKSGN